MEFWLGLATIWLIGFAMGVFVMSRIQKKVK
jgi:hypothetical protein